MLRRSLIPMAATLIAAGSAVTLRAGKDLAADAETQMKELYQTIAISAQGGKPDPKVLLILKTPGTALMPEFDPDGNDNDRIILNELVDAIPMARSKYAQLGSSRYSDLYSLVMQNHQPTVHINLTQAEKDKLEADKAWLDESNQDTMGKYRQFEKAYLDLLSQPEPDTVAARSALKTRIANAKKTLENNGGFEYLKRSQEMQQLSSKDGKIWWETLRDKYNFYLTKDPQHPEVFVHPNLKAILATDSGWTGVRFKHGQTSDTKKFSKEDITASASGSYKWFSGDTKFSMSTMNASELMTNEDLEMTFKITAVDVYRPWMDQNVFKNGFWTLPKTVSNGVISFGSLAQNAKAVPDVGMPVLVTRILLLKDLDLKTHMDTKSLEKYSKAISSHTTVGIGPLTLNGGYDKREKGSTTKTTVDENGVHCEGVQILGVYGVAIPECPKADIDKARQRFRFN